MIKEPRESSVIRTDAAAMAFCAVAGLLLTDSLHAAPEIARTPVYAVTEIRFAGPPQTSQDTPARDIDLQVRFRHQATGEERVIHGFWDGDGQGGVNGNVFKVRFTPTVPGAWRLEEVLSNQKTLQGQKQGSVVAATVAEHPGFWLVDTDSPGRRWYRRSDGSHPYIFGNTHYSFLSGYEPGDRPSGNDIAQDIAANAGFFKKLRFALHGDRYPHPTVKPFLDDDGRPTDAGDFSHRPNPAWFHNRMDVAVKAAYDHDLIADLILAGPDEETSRATLRARHNGGDPTPYLKYVAARYGSFPNVWICLCNEYEIRTPKFDEREIARFGRIIRPFLAYPTPLSVHATPRTLWSERFDRLPPWADHMIIQKKIRSLAPAADVVQEARRKTDGTERNMPVVNDELSYQGQGDKHSEGDTIESHLGIFLGGGYGTTGEKPGNKLGQYFRGKFNAAEHTAADNLAWLREQIDANVTFWKMAPALSIFTNLDDSFRGLAWSDHEYVLGTNKSREGIVAQLPEGRWRVTRYDVMRKESKTVATDAEGRFTFDAPSSRAVFFHFKVWHD